MDRKTIEAAIKAILAEINDGLQEAASIATAANACAEVGNIEQAVQVSMGIEQILYEAGRLQDAASLLNRLSKECCPKSDG